MNKAETGHFIIGNLTLIDNKITLFGDELYQDLTFKQVLLLVLISKMKQKRNINQIARESGSSRQNIKKMLSVLQQKGYLTMSPSTLDQRSLVIALTEKTMTFFKENDEITQKKIIQLFDDFTMQELTQFLSLTHKLLNSFEKMVSAQ